METKKLVKKLTTLAVVSVVCTSQIPLHVFADTTDTEQVEMTSQDNQAVDATNELPEMENQLTNNLITPETETETETEDLTHIRNLLGLYLQGTVGKSQLDLDKNNDMAEIRFLIRNDDGTSKLNAGVLTIDLSQTKLKVVAGSFPTKGSGIKSVTYTNADEIIRVELVDGFSGSTEFPFSVTLKAGAKSGEAYQIPAVLSGKNSAAVDYLNAEAMTDKITVVGKGQEITEATVETYAKWTGQGGSPAWSAASGYPKQSVNTYNNTPRGNPLHFSNLRIEKVYSDASFYWGNRAKYDRSEFYALSEIEQRGSLEEYVSNSKLILSYGDMTISALPIYDNVYIPDGTPVGVYTTDYKIYNGENLLYTTTRKITVKEAVTIVSFSNKISSNEIGRKDYFNMIDNLKGNSAAPGITNLTQTLVIPDGIAPIQYTSAGVSGIKVEYEMNHSGDFILGTHNFSKIASPENITRVRLTYPKTMGIDTRNKFLVLKNVSAPEGEVLSLGTESLTYTDYAGNGHDYLAENPDGTYMHTVTVSDKSFSDGQAEIDAADYGYKWGEDSSIPTNLSIYNGARYLQAVEMALKTGGQLKRPYAFVILPKGVTVKNENSSAGFTTNLALRDFIAENAVWKNNGKFSEATLLDGRTIYYYRIDDELSTDGLNLANIQARFNITFDTVASGQYELEYGVGAADSDDYTLNANITKRGYKDGNLSNEIQTILDSNVTRYMSKKQTISVGELNSVSSAQSVKGSEDGNTWIDGNVGSATSIPGTTVDYRYQLTNNGTSTMKNFELIDMLPYEGDSMITNADARNSDYSILATDSVNVKINDEDAGMMIYYSQSTDPVRFDAAGKEYGTVDDWSPTKPSDITKVKAIKVKLTDDFKPGDKITFEYTGQVPGDAPRDNVSVAYNSLAYRGFVGDAAHAKELGLTGVKATQPVNDGEISGDLFSDMNKNGEKDSGEKGYNGVVLELFKANDLSKPVTKLNTSPTGGVDGHFLFTNIAYGKYKIRVTLPEDGEFIASGKNKILVDSKDEKYGWLQVSGSDLFEVTDVGGVNPVLSGISGAIYRYTPLAGTIVFKDRSDTVMSGNYGQDFTVTLLDEANKKIAETTSGENGIYKFDALDIPADGKYKVKFTNPSGKQFIFKNTTGELEIDLIQGVGLSNGTSDIYITDEDLPTGAITFTDTQANPKKAVITHADETTETTVSWRIENSGGELVYSGTGDTITQELAYLKNDRKNGTYTLKVIVSDAAKNTLALQEDFTILVTAPTITTTSTKQLFEIDIDSKWTKAEYLSKFGIAATDVLGNPLTADQFTIDDSLVDETKEGDYEVKVIAKDQAGNQEETTITVQVKYRKIMVNYLVEGANHEQSEANYLSLLKQPTKPIKKGYTFEGWVNAETGGKLWNFEKDKAPDQNMTLYARFKINSYEVTFNHDGETVKQTVQYDNLVIAPTEPTKTGHQFVGWFDAKTGGKQWQFGTDKMPDQSITLYARFATKQYTVTFDNQGATTTDVVTFDTLLSKPSVDPTKPGYQFEGWREKSSGNLWNFGKNKVPATNFTLIASFKAENQVLAFDTDGGTAIEEMLIPTDSLVNIDALTQPTKSGYRFIGWFEGNTQISGTINMPIGGKTLTAHWTAEDQVITFDTDGGTGVTSIIGKTGTSVDLGTQETTREGYTFEGWFDKNNQQYAGVITVPGGGLSLKAKWSAHQQWIQFDSNGGTAVEDMETVTGANIETSKLPEPTRTGYEFEGWFDEFGNKVSGSVKVPAGGLKLKAEWIDLITSDIWQLNVENFEFTLSELNEYKAAGTLKEEVLKRSKARAFNRKTEEELAPLEVDLANLLTVTGEGVYQIKVSYSATPKTTRKAATFNGHDEIPNPGILEKEATVKIVPEVVVEEDTNDKEDIKGTDAETDADVQSNEAKSSTKEKDNLPKTSSRLEWLWEGYFLVVFAGVLFLKEKRKARKK